MTREDFTAYVENTITNHVKESKYTSKYDIVIFTDNVYTDAYGNMVIISKHIYSTDFLPDYMSIGLYLSNDNKLYQLNNEGIVDAI